MKSFARAFSLVFVAALLGLASCSDDEGDGSGDGGDDNPDRPDDTGAVCEVAGDCYPDVPEGELEGDAVCIERVRGGYCTHTCETDDDCCAAEGECDGSLLEVCSPFESLTGMHCFVSCEAEDVAMATDVTDENDFCQKKASTDFICRSSGGGAANRKICVPGDCGVGARCSDAGDCDPDLECVTSFHGGYCTQRGCSVNDDCPGGAVCVTVGDENFCHRPCTTASDCSLCRNGDSPATCRDDVTFAQADFTGSVCVPD